MILCFAMPPLPRLLLTRRLPEAVEARARSLAIVMDNPDDTPWSGSEIAALATKHNADALLVAAGDRLDTVSIEALPDSVKIIATFSVGYEHIALKAAAARGIVVTNTPDVLTDATADIAMLLILAASRRAYEGERLIREDRWTGWTPTQLLGRQITGLRLGILGMGRIGRALARRARAFGMVIHYHNRTELPTELPAELAGDAVYHHTPEGLVAVSDVLSLHAPASAETHHFLNAKRIALLPRGAIVVNTARGTLVDDTALIAALRSGEVAAAGLDVFEGEPRLHPDYRTLPNVFLLPHLGSATVETRNAMGFMALDNIQGFFAGTPLPSRVI